MIYGVNFGGPEIPRGVKHKFDRKKTILVLDEGQDDMKVVARLVGVCQSEAEKNEMLLQAGNGRRHFHVVARHTAASVWYGIYAY